MCSRWPIRGKVKSERAPSARIAAIAVEESSSSASMAPCVAMMAETPQTLEPTASSVVSCAPSLKVRPSQVMNVSENATADLTLKIVGAEQSVDVKAQSQSIATEDAVTGQVVDRRFINDLPLIDRNVMDLTYLAPGVTDVDDQCPNCGGTNFASNGSRGASADILSDGASITNFEPNGGVTQAVYVPSPEAVEEFKVQQSNFSAEYGFSGASIINMVTRSGTNSFHGRSAS